MLDGKASWSTGQLNEEWEREGRGGGGKGGGEEEEKEVGEGGIIRLGWDLLPDSNQ